MSATQDKGRMAFIKLIAVLSHPSTDLNVHREQLVLTLIKQHLALDPDFVAFALDMGVKVEAEGVAAFMVDGNDSVN